MQRVVKLLKSTPSFNKKKALTKNNAGNMEKKGYVRHKKHKADVV